MNGIYAPGTRMVFAITSCLLTVLGSCLIYSDARPPHQTMAFSNYLPWPGDIGITLLAVWLCTGILGKVAMCWEADEIDGEKFPSPTEKISIALSSTSLLCWVALLLGVCFYPNPHTRAESIFSSTQMIGLLLIFFSMPVVDIYNLIYKSKLNMALRCILR